MKFNNSTDTVEKMIIDREYPATHSSDTAWFCVDLDGNVAVFDIDENVPTPNDFEWEHCIADLMTECLSSHTEENIYDLPLTDAQIKPMLLPHCFEKDISTRSCLSITHTTRN